MLNHPEVTRQALSILRSGANFQWYVIALFVYIPFFLAAFYCYDWKPKTQAIFIGSFFAADILMLGVFAGLLHWI